jgi:hypothetical protein
VKSQKTGANRVFTLDTIMCFFSLEARAETAKRCASFFLVSKFAAFLAEYPKFTNTMWDGSQFFFGQKNTPRCTVFTRMFVLRNRKTMDDDALIRHLRQPFDAGKKPEFLEDDEFLHPYLPDDALLPALSCDMWDKVPFFPPAK